MEIILQGITENTLQYLLWNNKKVIKGIYLDSESDLYTVYLKNITTIKTYEDFIVLFVPYYFRINSGDFEKIIIQ